MRLKITLFILVIAATAQADWTIVSSNSEAGRDGVIHKHLVLENAADRERVTVDLAIFSAKTCTLRLVQNENGGISLREAMNQDQSLAGVNGGYFDEAFAPIGLRVVDGKMLEPLKRARLITGVLIASVRGVQIVRAREFSTHRLKATTAIQCGPFLVDLAKPVGGLNGGNRARRTFAATASGNLALLGFCSRVSLAELSKILLTSSVADDLKIERALNLDGGSSSGFWFARENGSAFSIGEQKPVRDFVAIVPR
ncbi:MAG TPA: phosphodiester glycosidase family protein [Candidatus Udaeobacter sp.]|jgi:uncharacterized protein YigE (DUF2233 family)|nr:phosphodiester glycosidase family protein [Candidatus Udaeobacter sp.]